VSSAIIKISVDGSIERIETEDNALVHEAIHEFIGNLTDHFHGKLEGEQALCFCDDIGIAKRLPVNKVATEMYDACCRPEYRGTHSIRGPVVAITGKLAE